MSGMTSGTTTTTTSDDAYTCCWGCLTTVKILSNGTLAHHLGFERFQLDEKKNEMQKFRATCPGSGEKPRWIETGEGASLNARGRNPGGFCMRCNQHVSEGENPDCPQCCFAKRNAQG